ncbi:DUF885 domain-containing protein [Urechidicola croceus]|uniref:DUF885 domain-containing protein n=1 Tax=Urechidicola croceus TaxID=1850246 RepID=A0A1D8P7E0_9FLAO|nr:DUF885 domain-containing protein [Urechidicola croceus]AOW20484.1 hypothetical protein LPB138_07265 [Urechidicola croceus]
MKKISILCFCLFIILSCNLASPSPKLNSIIDEIQNREGYDKDLFPLGIYTEDYYKNEAKYAKEKLVQLEEIDTKELNETENISLELMKFQLQETVDFYKFEAYLNPLLSDYGFHNNLPYIVSPLNNYKQVKEYLNKLKAIPTFIDDNLVLLRKGLEKGVSQPKVIFENGYETSYNTHIVDNYEDSYYYSPFKNLPEQITQNQKDSILIEAKLAIEQNVIPQFKIVKDFFENEYLNKTRNEIGVSSTPSGNEYYQNRIKYYTTLDLTANEIHQTGISEVARIKSEMKKIIGEVDFEGTFEEFIDFLRTDEQFYAKTPESLLKEARNIAKKVDAQLPRYFITLPRKPYGVAPVPDAIAPKYTTGRYIGTEANSTEPGYYWVNTYDLKSRPLYVLPSLTVHEAVPGHHLQGSLNNELGDSIPQFRRDMYLSAYGEGWGLYCEFLAEEMGIYETPYERFGKLTYEMWRACRLVIDTGIHTKGWSREQAVEYMSSNSALSLHNINTEIDRYISWPGQALSYKIGELTIRKLREQAKIELGTNFDIREFHEVILEQGTVTLAILEERINKYILRKKVSQ